LKRRGIRNNLQLFEEKGRECYLLCFKRKRKELGRYLLCLKLKRRRENYTMSEEKGKKLPMYLV
jgi:hypothetical protein